MTQTSSSRPRRLRAALIGFGLDGDDDGPRRVSRSAECLVIGGSAETHAEMREAITRVEIELEAMRRHLGELNPADLADLAFRVDLPELRHLALKLEAGLQRQGRAFEEVSANELAAFLELDDWMATVEN